MSGIFNLFGETTDPGMPSSTLGPTELVKTTATNSMMFGGGIAGKNVDLFRSKPKGLSIRSGNNVNILTNPNLSIKISKSSTRISPVKELVKPELVQSSFSGLQSPRNKIETLKIQTMKSKQLKALSSKTRPQESTFACGNKQAEEFTFRKPLISGTATRKTKAYRDPENLANDYDYDKELNDYDFDLDMEFVRLLKLPNNSVKPYEDEGFESDPETTRPRSPPVPDLLFAPFDEAVETETLELPTISDTEDF